MGTRDVSQCFERGVVGEGEVDIDDGLFYCLACWLIYHAARTRLRRDTAHIQPARNFQGVSYAPESAQHERSVQDVSFTFGRRPQLQRLGACTVAHRSPREQHMRMTLKPSSFKSVVGMRVRTPKVAALWRGVKNTSTRASM
jgi:hypothetical protein